VPSQLFGVGQTTTALQDQELIVLCDERGTPTGTAEKWSSHHGRTPLHLAFSCYVFDEAGAFLTTRRALTKKVWPGVWTNSVCGHPAPAESFVDAIARRVGYELGMRSSCAAPGPTSTTSTRGGARTSCASSPVTR